MSVVAQAARVTATIGAAPSALRLQMLLLTLAATAAAYARFAVSPLQETMRLALSLSDNHMALLQGMALALPVVLIAVPLGLAIDRYSRVRLLLAFAILDVIGTVLTAMTSSFEMLFLARCLVGLAATATTTTAFSLLADLYLPAQRGRASTVVVVGQYGGMSAAFALGGGLLSLSGDGPDAWRTAILWLTVPLIVVAALTLVMREPPRSGLLIEHPTARDTRAELWRYRASIAPLFIGIIFVEIALQAAFVWAAPTLTRNFALAPDRLGAIMGMVVLVSGVLGPIAGGVLADLCQKTGGPRRTLMVLSGLTLLSVPAGFFAVIPAVTHASALLILFMTAIGAILVAGTALVTIVIPNELRGLCMSVLAAANVLLGIGLAPISVSLLSGVLGGTEQIGTALAIIAVSTSALGAVVFAIGSRCFPRTEAA